MKAVIWLLLRRRWYLFLSLMATVFMMTVLVWNEVGPYIQSRPYVSQLEKQADPSVYEIMYLPRTEENGLIVGNNQEEKRGLYRLFQDYFYKEGDPPSLYLGKTAYLGASTPETARTHLKALATRQLEQEVFRDYLDTFFIEDLLVRGKTQTDLEQFSQKAETYGFSLRFQSLQGKYSHIATYYRNNLIFGLVTSGILLVLTLALVYWITMASFKICQTELRVLRIVGLSRKAIKQFFSMTMLAPVSMVCPSFLGLLLLSGVGLTTVDLLCILGINLLIGLVIWWCVQRATREVFND